LLEDIRLVKQLLNDRAVSISKMVLFI